MKYTPEEKLEIKRARERAWHKTDKGKAYRKKRYENNKEWFFLNNKKGALKRKYKITLEQYQELFEKQNGVCAICKGIEEGRMLSVDHNHSTGKVRGLLCGSCNRALGLFQDSPVLLETAKEYVS